MFRNNELAAVGIDTLAFVLDLSKGDLEKSLSFPKDEESAMVMCYNGYMWYGFDFRQDPGQRANVIEIIADPSSFNHSNPKSPILKRGVYFAGESSKIDIGWYMT